MTLQPEKRSEDFAAVALSGQSDLMSHTELAPEARNWHRTAFDSVTGGYAIGIITERLLDALDVSRQISLASGLGAGAVMCAGIIFFRTKQTT